MGGEHRVEHGLWSVPSARWGARLTPTRFGGILPPVPFSTVEEGNECSVDHAYHLG